MTYGELRRHGDFGLGTSISIEPGTMPMLSIREWLRLVVLAALNLLLFRSVWWILMFPPVALVAVIVNLGLACTWVRPRSLNRGILAAMAAGLVAVVGSLAYLAHVRFRAHLADVVLQALPDPVSNALHDTLMDAFVIPLLDFALVVAIGIAAMLVAGWLAWPRSRDRHLTSAS